MGEGLYEFRLENGVFGAFPIVRSRARECRSTWISLCDGLAVLTSGPQLGSAQSRKNRSAICQESWLPEGKCPKGVLESGFE